MTKRRFCAPRVAALPILLSENRVGNAATRGAQNRRFVIAGRYCEHVFAEIGAAVARRSLQGATPGIRYFYEPQSGDLKMRTTSSCIGGKVADVDRTMVP